MMRFLIFDCKKFVTWRTGVVILVTICITFTLLQMNSYRRIKLDDIPGIYFTNKSSISSNCDCERSNRYSPLKSSNVFSTCDYYYSAIRGAHQNVVSYTFFGNTSSIYFRGVELTLNATAKSYPGWIMRLYHNFNMSDIEESGKLCQLWCKYDHFDLCDVTQLPYPLRNKSNINGELWRFLVLGDPLVDRFMMRDIDAPIMDREVAAVNEWLNSNKSWHIMRDHPWHSTEILAGMWGGSNSDLDLTTKFRSDFILLGTDQKPGLDQELLRTVVWPFVFNDAIIHDSYTCKMYPNARPFPTQLEGNTSWVGHSYEWRRQYPISKKCPDECRPKDHQDWEYC